jgi:hypothetical protein
MATRSRIGIRNEDGTFTSVYCHWDGYPSNNGRILKESFKEDGIVRELIGMGSLSSLAPRIHPEGKGHTFTDPEEGCCVFYGRDRGETDTGPDESENLQELLGISDWCDYLYIFEANEWFCIKMNNKESILQIDEALEVWS